MFGLCSGERRFQVEERCACDCSEQSIRRAELIWLAEPRGTFRCDSDRPASLEFSSKLWSWL